MASRTSWTAGNSPGFTWTAAFSSTELASLPSGSGVLSDTTITNQTNLDIYSDWSLEFTISSGTPSAGGFMALYLAALLQDGSTFGDGSFGAGIQAAVQPPYAPAAVFPFIAQATTLLAGFAQGIVIPPGTFSALIYNSSGLTLSSTASNSKLYYRTYNINLND